MMKKIMIMIICLMMINMVCAIANDPIPYGNATDDTVWIGGADGVLWSTIGDTLYVNGTEGNVGIGTTSPSEILHIVEADNVKIRLEDDSTGESSISFANDDKLFYIGNEVGGISDGFGIYDGTAAEPRVAISSGGYFGINTNSPAYDLEVVGNRGINVNNGTASYGRMIFGDPADPSGYVGIWRGAQANYPVAGNSLNFGSYSPMAFTVGPSPFASQTQMMTISTSGVGFGATTPSDAIHVNAGAIRISGSGDDPGNGVGLFLNNTAGDEYPTTLAGYAMQFWTGANDARKAIMSIRNAGYVGIGTTASTSVLEVQHPAYDFALTQASKPTMMVGLSSAGGSATFDMSNNATDGFRMEMDTNNWRWWSRTATNTFIQRLTLNGLTGLFNVVGEITAGTKTFMIDHPENPLLQFLKHIVTESPEPLVNYRGTNKDYNNGHGWNYTVTDLGNNQYKIKLPSWFDDLTFNGSNYDEYTGLLSGRNSFCGDSYFDFSNVGDNEFVITVEKVCNFSWDIKAVRHDPFYENHKVQVVVEKEDEPFTKQVSESKEVEGDYEITYNKTEYTKNINGVGVCRHDECNAVEIPKPVKEKIEISRVKIEVINEEDVSITPDEPVYTCSVTGVTLPDCIRTSPSGLTCYVGDTSLGSKRCTGGIWELI